MGTRDIEIISRLPTGTLLSQCASLTPAGRSGARFNTMQISFRRLFETKYILSLYSYLKNPPSNTNPKSNQSSYTSGSDVTPHNSPHMTSQNNDSGVDVNVGANDADSDGDIVVDANPLPGTGSVNFPRIYQIFLTQPVLSRKQLVQARFASS